MKDIVINQKKIYQDIHLKNIFIKEAYLELGVIDYKIITKLLKFELVNINDLAFFPVQNKGIGHSNHPHQGLKNSLPYYFFYNLALNNTSNTLCITYGLVQYKGVDKRDSFMPVIIIPIKMYYEEETLLVQMIYKPVINPMLNSIINQQKLSSLHNLNLLDIKALDYILFTLSTKLSVKPDNLLSYYQENEKDIILPKRSSNAYKLTSITSIDKLFQSRINYYYSILLNKEQRTFIKRCVNKESLTLIGVSGTGKTTVLKNIIINNLLNQVNTLFISESQETIKDVYDFLWDLNLGGLVSNLTHSFPKMQNVNNPLRNQLEEVSLLDDFKSLNDLYEKTDKYEIDINKNVKGFKIYEAFEEFFLTDDDISEDEVIDDLSNIYKHEYQNIFKVLKTIESLDKKIKSFKNSVWNAIPVVNNIKHVNQVINIVFQLNQGLKKLRNYEVSLVDYGVKSVLSFSEMKKYIAPLDKMNLSILPVVWMEDIDVFNKAKEEFVNLKKDINEYNELIDDYNANYLPIQEVPITSLYGKYYNKTNHDTIDALLKNKTLVMSKCNEVYIDLGILKKLVTEVNSYLKDSYFDLDEKYHLYDFLSKNIITRKLLVLNDLKPLNEIIELINKYEKKLLIYKKVTKKLSKNQKVESDTYQEYCSIINEIENLKEKYFQKSLINYRLHDQINLEAINKFVETAHPNIVNLFKIFDLDSYNNFLNRLKRIEAIKAQLLQTLKYLKQYEVDFSDDLLVSADEFINYYEYLKNLFQNNNALLELKKNNKESFISVSEYYSIQEKINKKEELIAYFNNKKLYKKLFGNIYEQHHSNLNHILKIIQMYDAYIFAFTSFDKVYESFLKFDSLVELVSNISNLITDIGESLRLYSLIFKDSVSRYYFSNIENNINYLTNLLNSKDELVTYLAITYNLGILNDYKLTKLISYIENSDDVSNISKTFKYVYFKNLIDEFLVGKSYLLDTTNYLQTLEQIINKEKYINNHRNNKILNAIDHFRHFEMPKPKIKHFRYSEFFKTFRNKINIYLTNKDIAINHCKDINYDVVIIDDAHCITTGEYAHLFKNKQVIISGDYQNNKIVNQNLLSLAPSDETIVLKSRYVSGPRALTMNFNQTRAPHLIEYDDNYGIKVINNSKDLINYIYEIYSKSNNATFNIFIKNIAFQKEIYEDIALVFYEKKVNSNEITSFLLNQIFVADINNKLYKKCDYNIFNFNDYYEEESQIMASNIFEILVLAKKELIIYDQFSLLEKEYNYSLFNRIKKQVNTTELFLGVNQSKVIDKIKKEIEDRGYLVYLPGSAVSFLVRVENKLIPVVILFSNNNTYEVLNEYRDLQAQYQNIHFLVIADLYKGVKALVTELLGEICG